MPRRRRYPEIGSVPKNKFFESSLKETEKQTSFR